MDSNSILVPGRSDQAPVKTLSARAGPPATEPVTLPSAGGLTVPGTLAPATNPPGKTRGKTVEETIQCKNKNQSTGSEPMKINSLKRDRDEDNDERAVWDLKRRQSSDRRLLISSEDNAFRSEFCKTVAGECSVPGDWETPPARKLTVVYSTHSDGSLSIPECVNIFKTQFEEKLLRPVMGELMGMNKRLDDTRRKVDEMFNQQFESQQQQFELERSEILRREQFNREFNQQLELERSETSR